MEQGAVLTISLLIIVVAIYTAFLFFTGIGQRVYQRWRQRLLYKRGLYVNTIFTYNTGVARELFIKKDKDAGFTVDGKKYVVNRQMTILLDGIPTQRNIENITEPVPWDTESLANLMSTGEIEQIISNNEADNLAKVLMEYKTIALIFVIVMVVAVLAAAYMNWQIYDVLVQQGFKAVNPVELVSGR